MAKICIGEIETPFGLVFRQRCTTISPPRHMSTCSSRAITRSIEFNTGAQRGRRLGPESLGSTVTPVLTRSRPLDLLKNPTRACLEGNDDHMWPTSGGQVMILARDWRNRHISLGAGHRPRLRR